MIVKPLPADAVRMLRVINGYRASHIGRPSPSYLAKLADAGRVDELARIKERLERRLAANALALERTRTKAVRLAAVQKVLEGALVDVKKALARCRRTRRAA